MENIQHVVIDRPGTAAPERISNVNYFETYANKVLEVRYEVDGKPRQKVFNADAWITITSYRD